MIFLRAVYEVHYIFLAVDLILKSNALCHRVVRYIRLEG